jgi:magnesium transporter
VRRATLGTRLLHDERASRPFTWIDLEAPSPEDVALVGTALGLHELAVRGAIAFGRQPSLDEYEGLAVLVAYLPPAAYGAEPVEFHAMIVEHLVVTMHREPAPALERALDRFGKARWIGRPSQAALALSEAITEEYDRSLERMDSHLDHVEEALVAEPAESHLDEIQRMRKALRAMRRSLIPMRDAFGPLGAGSWLAGAAKDDDTYLRYAAADLSRAAHRVEELRDRATNAMDVYLNRVNNRMNQVMERLTLVATIFLPLSFWVGFFGQNFAWMVQRIDGPGAFVILGLVFNVMAITSLVLLFRRKGWI